MVSHDWVNKREYPFEARYLPLDMGRMHYIDEGAGQPILFVHGTPTWSFLYRHLIKHLTVSYRCIAPDHIGFGLSDKPENWTYLPQAHAANLKTFIERLDLKDITLVVHDYGGPIGLSYALERPENVKRIVLFNTWMWPLKGEPRIEKASKLLDSPIGRLLYLRMNFSARVLLKQAVADPDSLPPAVHGQYTQAFPTRESRKPTLVFGRELLKSGRWFDELWQQRAKIRDKPALILWGERDPFFTTKDLARWGPVFASARTITFPDAGHLVPEEMGQRLYPVFEEFLAGTVQGK